MQILAIDTTTKICSVAIQNNSKVYFYSESCIREHNNRILPIIQNILNKSNIILKNLDALAFGCGPGSFTGVRIGIGVAQGLALGDDIPIIGISSLVTIAEGAWSNTGSKYVLVAIDANMGEVYWAEYIRDQQNIWHGEQSESLINLESVSNRLEQLSGEWTTAGTGWNSVPNIFLKKRKVILKDSKVLFPIAKYMLPIACQLLSEGKTVSVEKAKPIYLQKSETWKK